MAIMGWLAYPSIVSGSTFHLHEVNKVNTNWLIQSSSRERLLRLRVNRWLIFGMERIKILRIKTISN